MGRDRRRCAWLQPGTAARLKAGLPKAPHGVLQPVLGALTFAADAHGFCNDPRANLSVAAVSACRRDACSASNFYGISICGRCGRQWVFQPSFPPYCSPCPLQATGRPISARGPEGSHSPTPATFFAAFTVLTASTANAWGLPVLYPPAFTVENRLGQHRHMMSRKHPILCILYRIFAEYCIPISIFLQIYS